MKGNHIMELSKCNNDYLVTRLDEITREIKRRKNFRKEYAELQEEYEAIKGEVLRRMR